MSRLPLDAARVGSGPPVVFMHGFGASRFTFRFWAEDLARDHELHLLDLVGFGAAPAPTDGRYGPLAQADLVTRYLLRNDLRDVTLVGHSLGGGVALLVALLLRDQGEGGRLSAVVSVAGPAYPQSIPRYIALARLPLVGRLLLRVLRPERVVRTVLRYVLYDPAEAGPGMVEGYAAPLRTARTRRALVETARQILPERLDDIVARFPSIHVPTLLLWGDHDRVVPSWVGRRLAADLPDARLVVLERCGHVPPEERPERSLAAVRAFLAAIER